MNWKNFGLIITLCTAGFAGGITQIPKASALTSQPIINEVAWMGTTVDANDEWMELHNPTANAINLTGWKLKAIDGTPSISLSGMIDPGGFYLVERTDDNSVPGIKANLIYTGALSNTGETLQLVDPQNNVQDTITAWHAGEVTSRATMERKDASLSGDDPANWITSTTAYDVGLGTPLTGTMPSSGQPEQLNSIQNGPGAINVYFNKSALTQYASAENKANYQVNLENRLLNRINSATKSIDIATYEINLPKVVDALINRAANGVQIRMIADAKGASDPEYDERYELMRLYLERLIRGKDGVLHTTDDSVILSDSAMFAVEDSVKQILHKKW
jgi:hypothetical protein